jgi:hypothetical protein
VPNNKVLMTSGRNWHSERVDGHSFVLLIVAIVRQYYITQVTEQGGDCETQWQGRYTSESQYAGHAVMDVIRFLCVSLGSSTVQLHCNVGSRRACACSKASFSTQNGDRDWGVYYRRSVFVVRFCGQKDAMQRILIKKCFLFTVGSVFRVKLFTAGWQTYRWCRRGWNGGAEVAETTVRQLLCCGFRRTGKAMEQVFQCWWRICREMIFFLPGSNITRFTFYIRLWPVYWLSLVRARMDSKEFKNQATWVTKTQIGGWRVNGLGRDVVNRMKLTEAGIQRRAIVNTIINLRVLKTWNVTWTAK